MSETFAVVLADPVVEGADAVQKVAQSVSAATGMIPYDAAHLVKNAQGVLIENVSEFQARKIVDELAARGVQAGAADAAALGAEPRPRPVREVAVSADQLTVQLGYSGMDAVPWERVDMLSVCLHWKPVQKNVSAPKKTRSPFVRIGIGFMTFGPLGAAIAAVSRPETNEQRSTAKPAEDEYYVADIFLRDPLEILRLQSNACRYNYLASRLLNSANENMKLAIHDIAALAEEKGVILSPMAQQFVDGDTLTACRLDNLHLFDRYNRWVFLALAAFTEEAGYDTDIDRIQ